MKKTDSRLRRYSRFATIMVLVTGLFNFVSVLADAGLRIVLRQSATTEISKTEITQSALQSYESPAFRLFKIKEAEAVSGM